MLKINKINKNGSKPLDNNDLATKQYTDEILLKLGEDLRKIITHFELTFC